MDLDSFLFKSWIHMGLTGNACCPDNGKGKGKQSVLSASQGTIVHTVSLPYPS